MARLPAGWYSHTDEIVRRMDGDAVRSGLKAAAIRLRMIIQRQLDWGYTSGDFSTGRVAATVIRSKPGRGKIWVGTPNPIAVAWECGHHNVFTGRYEREEIFRKSLEGNAHQLAQIFAHRYYEKLSEVAHKV